MNETQGKLAPLVQVKDGPLMTMTHDNMPTEIVDVANAPLAARPVTDIGAIIELAVREGRSADEMEKLVGLFERMQDRDARSQFNVAIKDFQDECPQIPRSRKADIVTKKGARFQYAFADLQEIDATIRPYLSKHGLSRRWGDATISDDGAMMTVPCILAHVAGHFESASFPVPTRTEAGMSDAQKYGSASTYAKRQSLIAVTGLTTCDPDNDGAMTPPKSTKKVSEEQLRQLKELSEYVGADEKRFFDFIGVKDFADILACDFERQMDLLESKKKRK